MIGSYYFHICYRGLFGFGYLFYCFGYCCFLSDRSSSSPSIWILWFFSWNDKLFPLFSNITFSFVSKLLSFTTSSDVRNLVCAVQIIYVLHGLRSHMMQLLKVVISPYLWARNRWRSSVLTRIGQNTWEIMRRDINKAWLEESLSFCGYYSISEAIESQNLE